MTRAPKISPRPAAPTRTSRDFNSSFGSDSSFGFQISDLRRNRGGFTLVEMITVLTIILIVLAIAIPVWDALMNGTNLSAAQNEISAYIANARADAIYNRQTIGVCFYTDPKTQQTGMAEVQVQTLVRTGGVQTNMFTPNVTGPSAPANGSVYSLELVNSPDPNNAGSFIFYRDTMLLPKGVGVALTNNTYTYNQNGLWNANPTATPFDRYLRTGTILFNPDGSLASIPWAIPYQGQMPGASGTTYNQLCNHIGMNYGANDFGSSVTPPGANPTVAPLYSSIGFVIYDSDVYLSQHANSTSVMDNSTHAATPIGDGAQFSIADMNCSIAGGVSPPTITTASTSTTPSPADKYLEEDWIDKNGTAFIISPNNGSVIRTK